MKAADVVLGNVTWTRAVVYEYSVVVLRLEE
jgi:hypothetical protein